MENNTRNNIIIVLIILVIFFLICLGFTSNKHQQSTLGVTNKSTLGVTDKPSSGCNCQDTLAVSGLQSSNTMSCTSNKTCLFQTGCLQQSTNKNGNTIWTCTPSSLCNICSNQQLNNWPSGSSNGLVYIYTTINGTNYYLYQLGYPIGNTYYFGLTNNITGAFSFNIEQLLIIVDNNALIRNHNYTLNICILNYTANVNPQDYNQQWIYSCGTITDPNFNVMMAPINLNNNYVVGLKPYDASNNTTNTWAYRPAT